MLCRMDCGRGQRKNLYLTWTCTHAPPLIAPVIVETDRFVKRCSSSQTPTRIGSVMPITEVGKDIADTVAMVNE